LRVGRPIWQLQCEQADVITTLRAGAESNRDAASDGGVASGARVQTLSDLRSAAVRTVYPEQDGEVQIIVGGWP
jgi:hypothetical protein